MIQNPGTCAFDPESLLCRGGDAVNCLTPNQVNTLNAWFAAAKDEQGRVVSLGFPVSDVYNNGAAGNNLFRWTEAAGPPRGINSADPWGRVTTEQAAGWAFYAQSFKYLVYLDPHFDNNHHSAVDRRGVVHEVSLALLEARTQAGRSDDPQKLAPFAASDRKMILFHGYSDGFINPFRTIRFYQDWAELRGGYEILGKQARLFMAPGMYHCNRGPGPNVFDALGALEQWVEHGRAPEQMMATKYRDDDRTQPVLRTMPLCRFPTQARLDAAAEQIRNITGPCGAGLVLDCVGVQPTVDLGARLLGRNGRIHAETSDFPLEQAVEVYDKLKTGQIVGPAVLIPDGA